MFKLFLFSTVLLVVAVSQGAPGLRISCDSSVGNYEVRAAFDSRAPVFFAEMVNDLEKPTKQEYLSKTEACGIKIDFTQNCTGSIQALSPENWHYAFTCNNGIHGELELRSEQILFSCAGPGVSDELHSLIFHGCKRILPR
jgi:hypothetical protein